MRRTAEDAEDAEGQSEVETNEITEVIIGCAIQVHRELGPGLLESAYEACLVFELTEHGLQVERQKTSPGDLPWAPNRLRLSDRGDCPLPADDFRNRL